MNAAPTDSLGFLIHDAARLLRRRFEVAGSAHGLSAAQWRLLVHVVRAECLPQARLAELLEIEPISVSRLLDRMEIAGWVERRADEGDRRIRNVFPTERSLSTFLEIKAMAGNVYEAALQGIAAPDRDALMRNLKIIIANLGDTDAAPPARITTQTVEGTDR